MRRVDRTKPVRATDDEPTLGPSRSRRTPAHIGSTFGRAADDQGSGVRGVGCALLNSSCWGVRACEQGDRTTLGRKVDRPALVERFGSRCASPLMSLGPLIGRDLGRVRRIELPGVLLVVAGRCALVRSAMSKNHVLWDGRWSP
jgi:hypothetical protein